MHALSVRFAKTLPAIPKELTLSQKPVDGILTVRDGLATKFVYHYFRSLPMLPGEAVRFGLLPEAADTSWQSAQAKE